MSTLAALMVLVACHPDEGRCMKEPVAVFSFDSRSACMAALPGELRKARRLTPVIHADCIPVQADLIAGRTPILQRIEPKRLAALLDETNAPSGVPLLALTARQPVPVPSERY
ncbi:hypothetical protein DFR48_11619 [Ciceribacter lividus]|uniref:Uncharacterized protein n=1 Tax=Ciceribacter lividus TaxID=1197950 RepID=A0A6I7HGK1_9HYPH|nr:hypothetical protein [Ciceribacter lividus]RCW20014.1 hypothetical protein DFR48_11619 [Ciceribacter lividus]